MMKYMRNKMTACNVVSLGQLPWETQTLYFIFGTLCIAHLKQDKQYWENNGRNRHV